MLCWAFAFWSWGSGLVSPQNLNSISRWTSHWFGFNFLSLASCWKFGLRVIMREEHTVLGKNRMAWGREEPLRLLKHVLLVLIATKRVVFCWQYFSNLGLALLVYLRCLRQCRQFCWNRMVPFVGLGQSAHLPYYGVLYHVPHFSVLAAWEYVKRTISARADGAVCIGREEVPVDVFLICKLYQCGTL